MNVIDTIRNVVGGGLQGIGHMISGNPPLKNHTPSNTAEQIGTTLAHEDIKGKLNNDAVRTHNEIPSGVLTKNAPEQPVNKTEQPVNKTEQHKDTEKKPTISEQIAQAAKDSFGKNVPQNAPDAEKQALQMQLEQFKRQFDELRQMNKIQNTNQIRPQSPFQHEFSQLPPMTNAFLPMPQNQLFTGGQMPIGGYCGGGMSMMNPMMNPMSDFYPNMFASPSILGNNYGRNNFGETSMPRPIDSIDTFNAIGTTSMIGAMNGFGMMGGFMGGIVPPIIPVTPFPMM